VAHDHVCEEQRQVSSPYWHSNVVSPQAFPAVGLVAGQTPHAQAVLMNSPLKNPDGEEQVMLP